MVTNQSTTSAHLFANVLKSFNYKLFNVATIDRAEAQRQLRYAASLSEHEYRDLDLDQVYPLDIEETFRNLPDKDGIIVISNYDRAHEYMTDLIDFTLEYYEYRKTLSSRKDIVPVSGKWKFVITHEPGFRFNSVMYRSMYHFNLNP